MKKNKLLTEKILLPTLLALFLTTVIMPMEKASPTPTTNATIPLDKDPGSKLLAVSQTNTTVYLEAPVEYDYTDGSDPNSKWDSEENAWDQIDDTYANRTSSLTEDDPANRIEGTVNTAPGVGPAISRVDIGVEQFCTDKSAITKVKLQPVFNGTISGDVYEIDTRIVDPDKTLGVDVTSDTNAPSPWTWSDVKNLDVRVWGKWENPTRPETLSIDQIRVTVYSPTINGTTIGQEFTVNIMIRDASPIHNWGIGMIFDPDLLECIEFDQGRFLKNVGSTIMTDGTIYNENGTITQYGCDLFGDLHASGDGRLAYAIFRVKALGVSDPHLRDVVMFKLVAKITVEVPFNIIDTYTVVVGTIPHTVITVSNSTGKKRLHSGFYDHAYNPAFKEVSFKVTGPYAGFSNVTIPKTLFSVYHIYIDDIQLEAGEFNLTENANYTFVYFTYSEGIHKILITQRMSSTISMALSSTSITLGSNVTISGNITAEDDTARPGVTVTIQYRMVGEVSWHAVGQNLTDLNSNYTFAWTPVEPGTHVFNATWEGDNTTFRDGSDLLALEVLAIYVFEPLPNEYVVIKTNSTVSTFDFNQTFRQISFNVNTQYGTTGFSNVTIPKTLLNVSSPDVWKVFLIDVDPFNPINRTVTENATHSFLYFIYDKGIHEVQITTRISSTISINLSEDSIDLGSTVTINGTVTAADSSVRAGVKITIQYTMVNKSILERPPDEKWTTIPNVATTKEQGVYSYDWAPATAGVYFVTASWPGDLETIGDESEEENLTVTQNSTILIALSSANITVGSSVTISGSIDPLKPEVIVTIGYKLTGKASWTAAGGNQTEQDGSYTFEWEPEEAGTYEVKASWVGYNITIAGKKYRIIYGAESDVQTLAAKWSSTISIALSSANITKGDSVTISGNITVPDNIARTNATVTILYRLTGENWTTLTVTTDSNGSYTHIWEPEEAGTYEVKTTWIGDDTTYGNQSNVLSLTVEKAAAGFPLMVVISIVVVVAIVVIAAIAVYFIKFRKPR